MSNFVLKGEQIIKLPVIAFGPKVLAINGIDQLRRDAEPITGPLYTTLQHIAHAETLGRFLHLYRLTLVGEGGIPRDNEQIGRGGKHGDNVLGYPVAQVTLGRIAA